MTKVKELKEKSLSELKELSLSLEYEIFRFKNETQVSKKSEKPHLLREKKRERARVLTLITQKQA